MKRFFRKIWRFFMIPVDSVLAVAVLWDESHRQNLDGSWDKYWERKNKKLMKKQERKASR